MGYVIVLYGSYKKFIKRLLYFSPPTNCFYGVVFPNMLHTMLSELLPQIF